VKRYSSFSKMVAMLFAPSRTLQRDILRVQSSAAVFDGFLRFWISGSPRSHTFCLPFWRGFFPGIMQFAVWTFQPDLSIVVPLHGVLLATEFLPAFR
jgi:hypothetical protein